MSNFDIWQPRWRDRKVLLAKHKVGSDNFITFSKTPSLPGVFHITGSSVRNCPIEYIGPKKMACYAVPLDELHQDEHNEGTLDHPDVTSD